MTTAETHVDVPRQGGCLCGAVRYRLTKPVTEVDVCHCQMCRKHSGGIGLGLNVPNGGIDWTGEDNIRTYQSSDWAQRGFCAVCGSSLFWRMTAQGPNHGFLNLGAGTLDDLNGVPLRTEIYVDEQPDGYAFAGDTKKMTGAEVVAAFGGEASS